MKINSFRGDLTDISAKQEPLTLTLLILCYVSELNNLQPELGDASTETKSQVPEGSGASFSFAVYGQYWMERYLWGCRCS